MAEPLAAPAVKAIVSWPLPVVATGTVGAAGAVDATTALEATDATDAPDGLVAVTV